MPFNANGKYKPSDEFKKKVKRCLLKHLCSSPSGCTQEEYKEILNKLSKIEKKIEKKFKRIDYGKDLTFEEKRDKQTEDIKAYAIPKIVTKLCELRERQTQNDSSQEELPSEDWRTCGTKENKTATKICNIWCTEREKAPRCGIILLFLDKLGVAEVLLTKYYKNDTPQYGYSKGKIRIRETIWRCAARETSEELGWDFEDIYNRIQDSVLIIKNVKSVVDNSSIEHYYFIVRVPSKPSNFQLDETEIEAVEWHSIYILPCCKNCKVIKSVITQTEANYFMVTCNDVNNRTSLVQDILNCMDKDQTASNKYKELHKFCRRR